MKLQGRKTYRHEGNPDEKVFHDTFINQFGTTEKMSQLIFHSNRGIDPTEYTTPTDEINMITLIQWLGSPVGQSFLRDCGFVKKKK